MQKKSRTPKTVYILGAGFSIPAGYPAQSKILENLFLKSLPNISDIPISLVKKLSQFEEDVEKVKGFIDSVYGESPAVRLEDVFTLLDHVVVNKKSVKNFSWRDLVEIDLSFKRSILFLFHNLGNEFKITLPKIYRKLASHLSTKREDSDSGGEKVSIISLNWDDLLEEIIYEEIRKKNLVGKFDIDYCCFTVPLDEETPHTPSFIQKAKGITNFKVLKLHGSINWLICPNCDRIYTGVGSAENRWAKYANPRLCVCNEEIASPDKQDDPTYTLQPFFVTPTYLKSFSNTHIQSIWNNAYTEISEATKIVFVGYSLPESDYHLRSLLVRALRTDTLIEVVLTPSDKAPKNEKVAHRSAYASHRFEEFFSQWSCKVFTNGFETYFADSWKTKASRSKSKKSAGPRAKK